MRTNDSKYLYNDETVLSGCSSQISGENISHRASDFRQNPQKLLVGGALAPLPPIATPLLISTFSKAPFYLSMRPNKINVFKEFVNYGAESFMKKLPFGQRLLINEIVTTFKLLCKNPVTSASGEQR